MLGDNGFRGLFREWTALFANPRWAAAAFHARLQPLAWFHVLTVVWLGLGQVLGAGLLLRAACWYPAVLVDGALQVVLLPQSVLHALRCSTGAEDRGCWVAV
jgi:hypothetical protein